MDIYQTIHTLMTEYGFHFNSMESLLYILRDNFAEIKIEKITSGITRIRYSPDGIFESLFSYAKDPLFIEEKIKIDFTKGIDFLAYESETLKLIIDPKKFSLRFLNSMNQCLLAVEPPVNRVSENGDYTFFPIRLKGGESFFGLGDKPVEPNLRGKAFELWGTDSYAYPYGADPLYKNIPFFIGQHSSGCYGIFLDSSYRTSFDFGAYSPGFGSYSDSLTYYFIEGNTPSEIIKNYLLLTGTPELPPLWALGYHQCKWSYYPEKKVKKIARKLRKLEIPCDAIYLDIDYMDGYRCFTWDTKLFPQPKKLIRWLEKKGFKTVVMIDPGLKIDKNYPVWKDGKDNDLYCKMPDGKDFKGMVWPGACNFPDFTLPKARDWWANLFEEFIKDFNIGGVWNDMNEPALYDPVKKVQTQRTFPDEVMHDYDLHPTTHTKAHNVYGMQMSRATYEGIKKFNGDKRPFVITRSTFSGGQRFACVWTGDNIATWEHLKIANWQIQSLSVSGFSFAGSDIGGFIGNPDGELYVRWLQLAVFHPFFRTHSSKGFKPQEPWSYGASYTVLAKKAIELRYKILPYLYSAFEEYVNAGIPVIMPLYLMYPAENITADRQDEFMFGGNILVAPVVNPGANGRWTYIPEGEWFRFESSQKINGGHLIFSEAELDTIPFYIKGGSVIPIYPVVQSTAQLKTEEIELQIYTGNHSKESILYMDQGEGFGYLEKEFKKYRFISNLSDEGFSVHITREGNWIHPLKTFKIKVYGWQDAIEEISVDGSAIPFRLNNDIILIDFPENGNSLTIK